jgi:hypothetical protein
LFGIERCEDRHPTRCVTARLKLRT